MDKHSELVDLIKRTENEFPRLFASHAQRDYGLLFYADDNKESHDSNHAILFPDRIDNLERVLADIADFYTARGITPRIYQPFVTGFFESNRSILAAQNFVPNVFGTSKYMLLMADNRIHRQGHLDIRRVQVWDERIATDIFGPSAQGYEVPVVRRHVEREDAYVFVGYSRETAVTMTYFHRTADNITRFDFITTAVDQRKKGYARDVLSHAVDFCRSNRIDNCYQWPAHPSSERLCFEVGFRVLFEAQSAEAVYSNSAFVAQKP